MGIFSARAIEYYMDRKGLVIDPRPTVIQPTSVDLHLHNEFGWLEYGNTGNRSFIVDPTVPGELAIHRKTTDEVILHAGGFVLGATAEIVTLPPMLVGVLMGKSTLARIGLQIESAGYVDPGWSGRLTLEMVNLGPLPIRLVPGMKICQIRFELVTSLMIGEGRVMYGDVEMDSHYQGSTSVVGARFGGLLAAPASPPEEEGLDASDPER